MTVSLVTVDTELSPGLHRRGLSSSDNLEVSVLGKVDGGAWGVAFQADRLTAHGLKGVFFVEALCAYALGIDVLKRVVDPILSRGHEVQLHLHTEWLNFMPQDPVSGARGENMADFGEGAQKTLLELGCDALVRAGAPTPVAFRAGNYGANNDTLRALAAVGVDYDSSYNEPFLDDTCRIRCGEKLLCPTPLDGVIEVPITFFEDFPGHTRPLQLCAVSEGELRWCVRNRVDALSPTIVVVLHSFELLDTRRRHLNKLLLHRFEALCATLQDSGCKPAFFGDRCVRECAERSVREVVPKSNVVRTAARIAEQAFSTLRHG